MGEESISENETLYSDSTASVWCIVHTYNIHISLTYYIYIYTYKYKVKCIEGSSKQALK